MPKNVSTQDELLRLVRNLSDAVEHCENCLFKDTEKAHENLYDVAAELRDFYWRECH